MRVGGVGGYARERERVGGVGGYAREREREGEKGSEREKLG